MEGRFSSEDALKTTRAAKDDGETDLVGLLRARASGAAALAGYRHQWGGRGRGRVRGRVQ